jgi:hypothetical protein
MGEQLTLLAADERTARALRIAAVMADERLFQAERVHSGHMGKCIVPMDDDGLPCWRFQVGLSVEYGRVRWIHGTDPLAVLEQAARVLLDGVRIQDVEGYAG